MAEVWAWKRCYTIQEVNSALSKVQLVGYSQKVVRVLHQASLLSLNVPEDSSVVSFCSCWNASSDVNTRRLVCVVVVVVLQELFGAVQVSPLSSGYSLGSSNWIIQSHYEKVSYMSGSSLLTTHPQVRPTWDPLRGS